MNIEIITKKLALEIVGFGDIAKDKDCAATAFKLSGKMWEMVKANGIKNKGKNIWVYDVAHKVFAGVELDNPNDDNGALEKLNIHIERYAYCKYIGSYNKIKLIGQNMTNELSKQGYEVKLPYIEIYGLWTADETKLETELFMSLR